MRKQWEHIGLHQSTEKTVHIFWKKFDHMIGNRICTDSWATIGQEKVYFLALNVYWKQNAFGMPLTNSMSLKTKQCLKGKIGPTKSNKFGHMYLLPSSIYDSIWSCSSSDLGTAIRQLVVHHCMKGFLINGLWTQLIKPSINPCYLEDFNVRYRGNSPSMRIVGWWNCSDQDAWIKIAAIFVSAMDQH